MNKKTEAKKNATQAMEEAVAQTKSEKYVLKLYITGMTRRSQDAIRNIKKIGQEYLGNNFELEVIDIYQQPKLAKGDQIIAVPTLVKKLPAPLRKLIGNLSQEEQILLGLDIKPKRPALKKNSKDIND